MSPTPQQECPRWERCSVNHCPLDPDRDTHLAHPKDNKRVCRMERQVRQKIAVKFPDILPWGGLTERETSYAQREAKLSPEVKSARIARMGKVRQGLELYRSRIRSEGVRTDNPIKND